MSHQAFSLLAKPIQRILWDKRWDELRPIQVDAIHHVLESTGDTIISAATAGGKTEAAFLPVLSQLYEQPGQSIRALYVGPLKALINDQFQRMETLCEHAEIPVHRWHGDVGAGPKRRMIQKPTGVLLITPESIESLMVNRAAYLPSLFRDLEHVVIDEIHAFVGTERGTHLRSLLYRLEHYSRHDLRMLGLSATMGDTDQIAHWFGERRGSQVKTITDDAEKKVLCQVDAAVEAETESSEDETSSHRDTVSADRKLARRMLSAFSGSTNLIFANARQKVEIYADLLNDEAKRHGQPPNFLVHHGALSRDLREQTEEQMQSDRPTTTVCSPTLELGIDIGSVNAVGQIGAPPSVASLVQRLGRSGRLDDQPSILRLYVREEKAEPDAPLPKHLYLELIQAIAVVELMLTKWVEPANPAPYDLSTMTQQVLSIITETGGITATKLYERLVAYGAFQHLGKQTLLDLLRAIAEHDLIEQTSDGLLILGLRGEKIVSHHTFYTAFSTPDTFQVFWESERIGEIDLPPNIDDHLILGGRRWQCIEIDMDKQVVLVRPTKGSKPPMWTGGCGEVHARIREQMREVLLSNQQYPYLTTEAKTLLTDARNTAARADLATRDLVPTGPRHCYWFPWTGTRTQRTLYAMCSVAGMPVYMGRCDDPCLSFEASSEEIASALAVLHHQSFDTNGLLDKVGNLERRKYDEYLSNDLLRRSAADEMLDLEGAKSLLSNMMIPGSE
jgi:ATP-dependent Lhr-like helicase